jgi:hypothetical protein
VVTLFNFFECRCRHTDLFSCKNSLSSSYPILPGVSGLAITKNRVKSNFLQVNEPERSR